MKTRKRYRLEVGQIWITRNPNTRTASRRVVAVVAGKVCYSAGGDGVHWCRRMQFRAWIRLYAAIATRPARPRTLTLKPLRSKACESTRKHYAIKEQDRAGV